MKKLVLTNTHAFAYLNKSFYKKELIIETIKLYQEFLNYSISELGRYIIIKITSITNDYSNEELANEILNYLIAQEYENLSIK